MDNKLIKLAMIYDTDDQDMTDAIKDIMESSDVDHESALSIAKALRAKHLPELAKDLDLSEEDIADLLKKDFSHLATLTSDSPEHNENGDKKPKEDTNVMFDEENGSVAKLELTVPIEQLKNVQDAVNDVLNSAAYSESVKIDNESQEPKDKDNLEEILVVNRNKKGKLEDKNMTEKELKIRKAKRDAIVAQAKDNMYNNGSSTTPFEYSEKGQFGRKKELPTIHSDGDDKDSFNEETEAYKKSLKPIDIYTLNGKEDFLLNETYDLKHFDGSPSGGYQYTMPEDFFDILDAVPTEGVEVGEDFAVPTKSDKYIIKTTRTSSHEDEDSMEYDMNLDEDETEDDMDETEEVNKELSPEVVMELIDLLDDENLEKFDSMYADFCEEHMPQKHVSRKETMASVLGNDFDIDKAEEVLAYNLKSAGVTDSEISEMTYAQGIRLAHKILAQDAKTFKVPGTFEFKAAQDGDDADLDQLLAELGSDDTSDDDTYAPSGTSTTDQNQTTTDPNATDSTDTSLDSADANSTPSTTTAARYQKEMQKMAQASALRETRMRTAYEVWSKLASLGQISTDEIGDNVNMWMEENLSTKAMINQGTIMIKNANANRKVTRSAGSQNSFGSPTAVIPAFSGLSIPDQANTSIATTDLQFALRDLFKHNNGKI